VPANAIQVPPGTIATTQQVSGQVAQTVVGVAGTLAGAGGAEGACGPAAAGAFTAMQTAWLRQSAYLGDSDAGLAEALGHAAAAYPTNDDAQMRAVWEGS
jgi:hypothetical protein